MVSENNIALSLYGHINTWDVSNVTDMQGLFENLTNSMTLFLVGMYRM